MGSDLSETDAGSLPEAVRLCQTACRHLSAMITRTKNFITSSVAICQREHIASTTVGDLSGCLFRYSPLI
jgi:hypothetical protein